MAVRFRYERKIALSTNLHHLKKMESVQEKKAQHPTGMPT
jgi:hypothetical protein